jgi:hypothetical protein
MPGVVEVAIERVSDHAGQRTAATACEGHGGAMLRRG